MWRVMRYNADMKTTWYFENRVLPRRPYLRREWCERVRIHPDEKRTQENGRIQHWALVEELAKALTEEKGGEPENHTNYLRVITLEDGETIHNAMPDRNYARRKRRQS